MRRVSTSDSCPVGPQLYPVAPGVRCKHIGFDIALTHIQVGRGVLVCCSIVDDSCAANLAVFCIASLANQAFIVLNFCLRLANFRSAWVYLRGKWMEFDLWRGSFLHRKVLDSGTLLKLDQIYNYLDIAIETSEISERYRKLRVFPRVLVTTSSNWQMRDESWESASISL